MIETPAGKPRVGKFVDYFDPRLMQRIGYTTGYGNRGAGPYAALVVNNLGDGVTVQVYLPGVSPMEFEAVPDEDHKDKNKGWWEWQTPIEKARAAKELEAAKAKAAEEAIEVVT